MGGWCEMRSLYLLSPSSRRYDLPKTVILVFTATGIIQVLIRLHARKFPKNKLGFQYRAMICLPPCPSLDRPCSETRICDDHDPQITSFVVMFLHVLPQAKTLLRTSLSSERNQKKKTGNHMCSLSFSSPACRSKNN